MRSEGGKASRPPCPRRILKPGESVREFGCAIGARYDDHSASRWQLGDSAADRVLPSAGPGDTETLGPEGWSAHGPAPPTGPFLVG